MALFPSLQETRAKTRQSIFNKNEETVEHINDFIAAAAEQGKAKADVRLFSTIPYEFLAEIISTLTASGFKVTTSPDTDGDVVLSIDWS